MTNCSFGRDLASKAAARMAVSKPLRGTRRLTPTTSSASGSTPKWARAAARWSGPSGTNRVVSTPGGTTVTGSALPAARSPSAAGYPPAAMMCWAPRSTCPSNCREPGMRPGTVTSAPCSTRSYGRSSDGPISPSGRAGSSTTRSAPTSAAMRFTRRTMPGCGNKTGSLVRSMWNGSEASNSAAPS